MKRHLLYAMGLGLLAICTEIGMGADEMAQYASTDDVAALLSRLCAARRHARSRWEGDDSCGLPSARWSR